MFLSFFFFNDTATTEIYTLSLHDALPILTRTLIANMVEGVTKGFEKRLEITGASRSEEHTSELQSHVNLVCRLLLEKKKKNKKSISTHANSYATTSAVRMLLLYETHARKP